MKRIFELADRIYKSKIDRCSHYTAEAKAILYQDCVQEAIQQRRINKCNITKPHFGQDM